MAEAMLAGLLAQEVKPEQVYVTNRSNRQRLQTLQQRYALPDQSLSREGAFGADIVLLAAKPKDLPQILKNWPATKVEEQCFISVAAGLSTKSIESCFSQPVRVVRTIPNTSSRVRESATAISRGSFATDRDVALAEAIFSTLGTVVVVEEEQLDAVTAISGSGPAYLYYLAEALEQAGIDAGLSPEVASQLTVQTFVGAAKMLAQSGKGAQTLREEVTSPNGTTQAGLEQLSQGNLPALISRAVEAAKRRSQEIGQELQ